MGASYSKSYYKFDELVKQYQNNLNLFFKLIKEDDLDLTHEIVKFNLKYVITVLEIILLNLALEALLRDENFEWLNNLSDSNRGYPFLLSEVYFITKIKRIFSLFDENDRSDFINQQIEKSMPILEKLAVKIINDGAEKVSLFFSNSQKVTPQSIVNFRNISAEQLQSLIGKSIAAKAIIFSKLAIEIKDFKEFDTYREMAKDKEELHHLFNSLYSSIEYRYKKLNFYNAYYEEKYTRTVTKQSLAVLRNPVNTQHPSHLTEEEIETIKCLISSKDLDEEDKNFLTQQLNLQKAEFIESIQRTEPDMTWLQQLLQNSSIEPLPDQGKRIVFQDTNLAKSFVEEIFKIGFENRGMKGARRKIQVLETDMEHSQERYAIDLTANEWDALNYSGSQQQQPMTQLNKHSQFIPHVDSFLIEDPEEKAILTSHTKRLP